jgi:F-type H+-transporting ATPase subunit b
VQFLLAAPALFLAAEEGGESTGSGADLLLPATSELIAGIIAATIIFFVVWRWVLPTLNETLAKRQEAEKARLEAAEAAKVEAESLLSDYRAQLAEAKEEAARIIDDARQTAESVRQETVGRAQGEADEILTRAREEAAAESARAFAGARSQVASLSIELAEKVVGQNLDRDVQLGLIDGYLRELEAGS